LDTTSTSSLNVSGFLNLVEFPNNKLKYSSDLSKFKNFYKSEFDLANFLNSELFFLKTFPLCSI
jgi:hypothetical protein